ncbi:GDSL-type esterase/lipase family protein [Peribacillus sp. B-H-3]|uniref:GDSL-type esterase/lipase family protein n=1 Tax=Peribacillus sp. B-H-3 TaxID=3400420 RepID=UPI003B016719
MNGKKKAASLALAGVLCIWLPFSAMAKPVQKDLPQHVQYVALGDSLAAGQTPNGYIDYSYADYLAGDFSANKYKYKLDDFDNFGVPGYTSAQVKTDLLKSGKIRKEVKEATHITLDIGANDLLGKLNDPAHVSEAISAVSSNLQTILSTIHKLNPHVKVYVMGYYNPYPYMPKDQQAALLPLLKALNAQIQTVTMQYKDTYVATESLIAKKYKEYITNKQNIHLSLSGYKVIAGEFWKAMMKK